LTTLYEFGVARAVVRLHVEKIPTSTENLVHWHDAGGLLVDRKKCRGAREEARREHRRNHDPILREAQAYYGLVRAWFDTETSSMRSHADALVRRAEVEDVDEISLSELSRILDAIEIVRHDCFLIYVKLRRAIDGCEEVRRARWNDPIQNDYNGSAKLALTCIDRSEGAWRAIDQWYPSCRGARALADQLAEMRTAVEERLPYARAFLRPGFDGLVTPD